MVNAMYRILIVEDDESIARSVKTHLESWNYEVCCAEDFSNVAGTFAAFDPQLVLMDVKLPFFNGYHWCSEIRKVSKVPVIFVSSASDNMNIVMAVSMGGDDFIAKPFDLGVLTAKVQAMLRRTYDFTGQSAVLEHKGAMLNLTEAALFYEQEKIELTKNEFKIRYCSLVPRSSNGFCRCFAFQIGKICCHHCIIRHFQFRKCLPVNSNSLRAYHISLMHFFLLNIP